MTDGDNTLIALKSPQAFPFGAKSALRELADVVKFPDGRPRTALVSERPSDDFLEKWGLIAISTKSPNEVWKADNGSRVEIYDNVVLKDGERLTAYPREAQQTMRQEAYFTRVDISDDEPDDTDPGDQQVSDSTSE